MEEKKYAQFIETSALDQQEYQGDINTVCEVATIPELERKVTESFLSKHNESIRVRYKEDFGTDFTSDLQKAKECEEDYYFELLKRGMLYLGYYTVIKTDVNDPELDSF